MMNLLKKNFALLLAVVLCLGLTACGYDYPISGEDWRTTGIVRDSGTITRNGEDTEVLLCVHASDATFYYDTEDQVLFDSVDYPITLESDAWEAFQSIDFADLNGDGNSDVTMKFDDGGSELVIVWFWDAEEGYVFREDLSTLIPVDSIQSRVPYFTRNGLEINAAMDKGTYLLKDGVCSYANLGDGYSTGDCYWEVIKNYDCTHDGIRELQFDAICYIPWPSIGTFNQKYITSVSCELYDFYSGMWFTAATAYGNSTRGENYYIHTIDWNGQSKTIEFAYSTDWQDNVGNWGKVLTKSYVAYLPEGYDGLVFAAEPQQDNYKDCAKAMQLDSISSEASIMDIDLVDPDGCLFFNVCS